MISENIKKLINLAVEEDIGSGDITTKSISQEILPGKISIIAKQEGIVCGLLVIDYIFREMNPNVKILSQRLLADGKKVENKTVVYTAEGDLNHLLTYERIALNFLQHMSGISTFTYDCVSRIEKSSKTKILDTRKTLPGFRELDKYAVKMGGGKNHRMGLFDMYMVKDNHIKAAGSITNAVNKIRSKKKDNFAIEVECSTISEVKEAVALNVDIIMLDNMADNEIKNAISLIDPSIKIEISGNVGPSKINQYSKLNIDYISMGSLTHSVKALDFSLNVI